MRRIFILVFVLLIGVTSAPVGAAGAFANPAFEAQAGRGESLARNFWGPLGLAKEGRMEDYTEAAGGKRLVQYFDKGRMELGADGAVTGGLLADELVMGRIQTGVTAFTSRAPYDYPIIGDARAGGLTYAKIGTNNLTAPQENVPGGNLAVFRVNGLDAAQADAHVRDTRIFDFPSYDDTTKQFVLRPFAQYREQVGLDAVGYAISHPITELVPVGGKPTIVTYQVFQRRVLTYTTTNPAEFQVEMGNVGQHYYQWRYGTP